MLSKEFVGLSDLYLAYKKAKSDAFFESVHFDALAFSSFERNLLRNLRTLERRIRTDGWASDPKFIGGYLFAPKALKRPSAWGGSKAHFSTLDPCEDWRRFSEAHSERPEAEFRLVMAASVNYQIINALWILKVGHLYESVLNKELSYGNRLRRRQNSWRAATEEGDINTDSLGLFKPYFTAYQSWRSNGLAAIKKAAQEGREVVAATMDARRFYHSISPEFLLRTEYLSRLGVLLTQEQLDFTRLLVRSLKCWYATTPDYASRPEGALPVGLSSSKVIANVALAEFDSAIQKKLRPIYYGRYVDDIFLVCEPDQAVASSAEFFSWMSEKYGDELTYSHDKNETRFSPGYLEDSDVVFSQEKQKVFQIKGEYGLDLVNQIEQQIAKRSSEYRLLPVIPETVDGMLSSALLATSDANLEADALRKADVVSIRRLGFAMLLGDVEAYARDLDPGAWKRTRSTFYELVERYVLTPQGIFDYFSYIVRVFGVAVASRDCSDAIRLMEKFDQVVSVIRTTSKFNENHFNRMLQLYARNLFQVALQASTVDGFRYSISYIKLMKKIKGLSQISTPSIGPTALRAAARELLFSDLGRRPYKDVWVNSPLVRPPRSPPVPKDIAVQRVLRLGGLKTFMHYVETGSPKVYWPGLAFATRPLTMYEITAVAPKVLQSPNLLRGAIFSLRGARTRQSGSPIMRPTPGRNAQYTLSVSSPSRPIVRVGLVSYLTELSDWNAALSGKPNCSVSRYKRFNKLINGILSSDGRIDYVVFPEASVPRRWAYSSAAKLARSGVSMLVGLENESPTGTFYNDALVALATAWPGYKTHISYLQPKMLPAHEERQALKKAGRKLRRPPTDLARPIYRHGDHFFGLLICSDFTNIDNRRAFQGMVETLFVLEWNKDINSFSALVEASAQDLHSFIVQTNSRQYGDSRVRSPAANAWERDAVRVKGGDEDYYVVAPLSIESIRAFQAKPKGDKAWKPLPIGYAISLERARVAGKASRKAEK